MTKQKSILLALTFAMIAAAGWFLANIHSFQRLGKPGVKTQPLAGSQNLEVVLPGHVLDYDSEPIPLAEIVTNTLPADTSYGQRLYTAPDGFRIQFCVVLMGGDRTSLHKPQFCLEGQGFQLGPSAYSTQAVPIERPYPYELSVGRLIGQRQGLRAVYVYYYVADGALSASASGAQRMWWMARDLIRTGVLQRWAYVNYLAICDPGQEDATFERMKTFIAASTPEFQLTPSAREAAVAAASK
jgi:hypothetical protein